MVFNLDVSGDGREGLTAAIALAWKLAGYEKPTSNLKPRGFSDYQIAHMPTGPDPESGPITLLFLTESRRESSSLPFKLDASGLADFARRWLETVEYPECPDIDGSQIKGWRVRHDSDGSPYQIWLTIEPVWILYGK